MVLKCRSFIQRFYCNLKTIISQHLELREVAGPNFYLEVPYNSYTVDGTSDKGHNRNNLRTKENGSRLSYIQWRTTSQQRTKWPENNGSIPCKRVRYSEVNSTVLCIINYRQRKIYRFYMIHYKEGFWKRKLKYKTLLVNIGVAVFSSIHSHRTEDRCQLQD